MRALVVLLAAAGLAAAQEPLPLTSARLAGETYTLSGRHTLDKRARLTLGPGVKVVGRGERNAIKLEGSLEIEGEPGHEVVFENVWIDPGWKFKRLEIAQAKFVGTGGVATSYEGGARGKASLDHVAFTGDASVWVTFHEGRLELRHVTAESTCQIASTGSDRNVKVAISASRFVSPGAGGVIQGGPRLHLVKEAEVTGTQVGGMIASFNGVKDLALERCRFDAFAFSVRQDRKDQIGKTKIVECDFASNRIAFEGPPGERMRITLEQCHFHGASAAEPDAIERDLIEAANVRVVVKAPRPEPNTGESE